MRVILRTCLTSMATLVACTGTGSDGGAGGAADGPGPGDRFVGAWALADFRSTNDAGETTFPYGENAAGQIVYTSSGRMSAQLMSPPDSSEAPVRYIGYWGTYTVDEAGTVTHHVEGGNAAGWTGSDRVRTFRFEGEDRLVLGTGQSRLTWVRVR